MIVFGATTDRIEYRPGTLSSSSLNHFNTGSNSWAIFCWFATDINLTSATRFLFGSQQPSVSVLSIVTTIIFTANNNRINVICRNAANTIVFNQTIAIPDNSANITHDVPYLFCLTYDGSSQDYKMHIGSLFTGNTNHHDIATAENFPGIDRFVIANRGGSQSAFTSGAVGPWFARDHFVSNDDFVAVLHESNINAPFYYTGATNMTGESGLIFAINHGHLTEPSDIDGGSPTGSIPGLDVPSATNLILYDKARSISLDTVYSLSYAFMTVTNTSVYINPYTQYEYYFTRKALDVGGTPLSSAPVSAESNILYEMANNEPTSQYKCIIWANSRGIRSNIDLAAVTIDAATGNNLDLWSQDYASGMALNLIDRNTYLGGGTFPTRGSAYGQGLFALNSSTTPYWTGTVTNVYSQTDNYVQTWRYFGNGAPASDYVGRGVILDGLNSEIFISVPDDRAGVDVSIPITIEMYILKYPGCPNLTYWPSHGANASSSPTKIGSGTLVSNLDTTIKTTTITGLNTSVRDIGFVGEDFTLQSGYAIYITDNTAIKAINVITGAAYAGSTSAGNTYGKYEKAFGVNPSDGDGVKIGPYDWEKITVSFAANEVSAGRYRGISIRCEGAGVILLSYAISYRTDMNGFIMLPWGVGGNGYTLQYDNMFNSVDAEGLFQVQKILRSIDPDMYMLAGAQQSTSPSYITTVRDWILEIKSDAEIVYAFEAMNAANNTTYRDTVIAADWSNQFITSATDESRVALSALDDPRFGSALDLFAEGLYANGGAHWNTLGNKRITHVWLQQAEAAALPATSDGGGGGGDEETGVPSNTTILIAGNPVAATMDSLERNILHFAFTDSLLDIASAKLVIGGIPICLYAIGDGSYALGVYKIDNTSEIFEPDDFSISDEYYIYNGFKYSFMKDSNGKKALRYIRDEGSSEPYGSTVWQGIRIATNEYSAMITKVVTGQVDALVSVSMGGIPLQVAIISGQRYLCIKS